MAREDAKEQLENQGGDVSKAQMRGNPIIQFKKILAAKVEKTEFQPPLPYTLLQKLSRFMKKMVPRNWLPSFPMRFPNSNRTCPNGVGRKIELRKRTFKR